MFVILVLLLPFHPSWGDAVQDVLILCMVNTQIGLVWGNWCEINISVSTTPPGAFLWSIIYVLKAKKLYLKIHFFAFPHFLIFKGIVHMEYLCWRSCWMSSRLRQWGAEEEKTIKKSEKAVETFFPDVRLMRCHADRACCRRALRRHSKGDLPWHQKPIG